MKKKSAFYKKNIQEAMLSHSLNIQKGKKRNKEKQKKTVLMTKYAVL